MTRSLRFGRTFLPWKVACLVLAFAAGRPAHAQTLALHHTFTQPPTTQEGASLSLRQALADLEKRYQITFGYPNNLIDSQMVSGDAWQKQRTAEAALRTLLKPFNLTFEKLGKSTFLINSKTAPPPVRPKRERLRKHSRGLLLDRHPQVPRHCQLRILRQQRPDLAGGDGQAAAGGRPGVRLRRRAGTPQSRCGHLPPAGFPLASNAAYTIATGSTDPVVPGTVVWRMGRDDNSSAEFTDYATVKRTDSLAVPTDWSTRTNWKIVSKGLKLDRNGALKLTYNLSSVPAYGLELSFRILDAFQSTPQMAVFSNNTMSGLIQIAGLNGNGLTYKFKETYRLYIPREFLKTGVNELRLEVDRGLFAEAGGDQYH